MANDYNDKVSRVLSLYQRLMEGEVVDKEVEAARYGVSARSIQRDISAINDFFEQETEKSGVINSIEYDKKKGGHYLSQIYKTRLTNSEILAICKILLDSRAFTRERMEHILDILVDRCTPAEGKAIVQDLIKNEEFHYIELTHKSEFVDKMWDIGQAIHQNRYLEMDYKRTKDGAIVKRRVKPVAIMFSEYYFYLTAFIEDEDVKADFDVIDDAFPTIYRIDRIAGYKVLDKQFKIPYGNRFKEGEFRKRIQFMYGGKLQKVKFKYKGTSVEAVLDRLPTAKILEEFVCIRNFIELLEQEKILAIHATVAEVKKYADGLRERGIQAKGFNERIFGIGHFYKFMEVKQYITRMPFRIEYFQQKEVIVHHDRSVEETVYMEILKKLYLFPERLRCMFLHLWCLGLRASEVCTLKGNAYYQQGEDYWIQVYQVKMKNYKRIPIPQALYQIMKVYLKKHEIQPEEFIFKNSRGGACLYGTFRTQMIEACRENKIANGEYLFQSHDYRHTVATMFYDSHVSLQSIRDYLGHTYEEMTRQYIDYMPQRIAKANDEFFEMQGSSLASWLKKEEKDGK